MQLSRRKTGAQRWGVSTVPQSEAHQSPGLGMLLLELCRVQFLAMKRP